MSQVDTRSRLLVAARQLFYAQGLHPTSLAAVAARADANPGSLYYFFKTKEELLLAVLHGYQEILEPAIVRPACATSSDPIERIFGILAVYRELLVATRCAAGCPIGNLAIELTDAAPEVRAAIASNFDAWCAQIEAFLKEAADRLPAELDRRRFARFVLTVMEGAVLQARGRGEIEAFDEALAELRRYLALLLERPAIDAGETGEGARQPRPPSGSAREAATLGGANLGGNMWSTLSMLGVWSLFGGPLATSEGTTTQNDEDRERALTLAVVIQAPLEAVWRSWTTEEGLLAVSPQSRVELRPGGDYAWFLHLEPDAQGRRGSEGSKVVGFEPNSNLVFDWTFPPDTPGLRALGATTRVTVDFAPLPQGGTRVRLVATGWQPGEEWQQGFEYFERAWSWVLQSMKRALEQRAEP